MNDIPAYDISFCSDDEDDPPHQCTMRRAIEATLRRHNVKRARINVAVVGDERMAQLNERFLGHSGSTDVLTFDLQCGESAPGPTNETVPDSLSQEPEMDGEIVLSLDTAAREARDRSTTIESEVALYAVHGTLHLLGHDDRTEADAAAMHIVEDEILTSVGLGAVFGSEQP